MNAVTGLALLLSLLAIFVTYVVAGLLGKTRYDENEIKRLFKQPTHAKIISCDLGRQIPKVRLRSCGLIGVPDVIFKVDGSYVCGEYKSRHFKGRITEYERYQCILYNGLLRKRFATTNIRSVIAYGNHRAIPVSFCENTFEQLLGLLPEFRKVKRTWRVVNPLPLFKR